MPGRCGPLLYRAGSAVAVVLMLACCTPGGQFDPTEVVNSDMFSTKKKLAGDREPVFPNGVPGAEQGVPPDLVKGYQQPPEQPVVSADAAVKSAAAAPGPPATAAAAEPKPKAKPKPKPKIAKAPAAAPARDPAWDQKPTPVGQPNWPAAPGAGGAQPQQAAQPAQTNWPAPPSTAPAQQPAQSVWPNPPPPGTH
jgi:hypothetical protein